MIRKTKKYKLDFKKTYDYFSSILKDGNTLSLELLEMTNFRKGDFFTLLPKEALISRIYQFPYGGIIPPKDVGYKPEYIDDSQKKFTPLFVHTLKDELVYFINEFLNKNPNLICVFEEIIKDSSDSYDDYLEKHIRYYKKEVYYHINYFHKTIEELSKIIYESEQVWHFVSIITETNSIANRKITLKIIRNMIQNIKLIIIGAYDGEGYIFWEKNK